jgi:hypothetical protein
MSEKKKRNGGALGKNAIDNDVFFLYSFILAGPAAGGVLRQAARRGTAGHEPSWDSPIYWL